MVMGCDPDAGFAPNPGKSGAITRQSSGGSSSWGTHMAEWSGNACTRTSTSSLSSRPVCRKCSGSVTCDYKPSVARMSGSILSGVHGGEKVSSTSADSTPSTPSLAAFASSII
jgi:hypothetical protein